MISDEPAQKLNDPDRLIECQVLQPLNHQRKS